MENNNWTQIKVTSHVKFRDSISAIMSMVDPGLMIEDYSDIEIGLNTVYGELIDEAILNADKDKVSVSIFVSCDRPIAEHIAFLRDRFSIEKIECNIETIGLDENEWASSWKQYYKPIYIGNRIVVCPPWEKCEIPENGILVEMDPGMAFGTGSHETTRLVMRMLENYVHGGENMLDVGCGSGILAICASKLGAKQCYAYDIDPVAVRVAEENVRDNDCTNIECGVSDLLIGVKDGKYDVITANIVADIIIRLLPDIGKFMHKDTVLVISGIIDERCADVYQSIEQNGFTITEEIHENGWCAISLRLA